MNDWIEIGRALPPICEEVIGYHKDWIDLDFNEDGTCICFRMKDGSWNVAIWCNDMDCWFSNQTDAEPDSIHKEKIKAPSHWTTKPIPPHAL